MAAKNDIVWLLKGIVIGACNCDWGCPCNFDAPPTYGNCNGTYIWQIQKGQFWDVNLDGFGMGWVGESPGLRCSRTPDEEPTFACAVHLRAALR
jgi:hypothetical protein